MDHWFRFFNEDDVVPVDEALNETKKLYYNNGVDMLKGESSIRHIAINHILTKSLEINDSKYNFFTITCVY